MRCFLDNRVKSNPPTHPGENHAVSAAGGNGGVRKEERPGTLKMSGSSIKLRTIVVRI